MKPESDPPSGGNRQKPRRGFAMEKRSDEAMEKDLWDLDGPPPADAPPPEPEGEAADSDRPQAPEEPGRTIIPVTPRSSRRDLVFKQSLPKTRPPHKLAEKTDEAPPAVVEKAEEFTHRITSSSASDEAFDDLEESPDEDAEPTNKVIPEPQPAEDETAEESPQKTTEETAETDPDDVTEPDAAAEESPPAPPINPVKELSRSLSKVERLGLIGFLAILVGGFFFFFANSLNKLPQDQKPLTPGDLPIAGKKISVDKILSYWRTPETDKGETVRRGTLVVPVVELGVSKGPGAVRIFFRDSDGATVGDGVTRTVNGQTTVTLTATAGFDDQGMFAAYRTGETKPWKIEVYEGPSGNAAGSEFKKLFEIPISPQRR